MPVLYPYTLVPVLLTLFRLIATAQASYYLICLVVSGIVLLFAFLSLRLLDQVYGPIIIE